MSDRYELYEPTPKTGHLGSIRIGRKSNHISPFSEISKEELIDVLRNGELDIRIFQGSSHKYRQVCNPDWVPGRWCVMIPIDWFPDEDTWLHRALGDNISNKKILILRREGRSLNRYNSELPVQGSWYKIAIEDTPTGNVLLRTFHNIPKESLKEPGKAQPTSDGWFFVGSSPVKPSTVGADKTFWVDLHMALN